MPALLITYIIVVLPPPIELGVKGLTDSYNYYVRTYIVRRRRCLCSLARFCYPSGVRLVLPASFTYQPNLNTL